MKKGPRGPCSFVCWNSIAQRFQPVQQIVRRLQFHGGCTAGNRDSMQRFEMRLDLICHFNKFQAAWPMHLGRFLLRTGYAPRLKQVHENMQLGSGQRCSVFHAFSLPFGPLFEQVRTTISPLKTMVKQGLAKPIFAQCSISVLALSFGDFHENEFAPGGR